MITKFVISRKKTDSNELFSNILNGESIGFAGIREDLVLYKSFEEASTDLKEKYSNPENFSIFEVSVFIEEK